MKDENEWIEDGFITLYWTTFISVSKYSIIVLFSNHSIDLLFLFIYIIYSELDQIAWHGMQPYTFILIYE